MKKLFLFAILLSSCSLFGSDDKSFDIAGEWADTKPTAADAGVCCNLDVSVGSGDPMVVIGDMRVPTASGVRTRLVSGTAAFDGETMTLSLSDGTEAIIIETSLVKGEWFDMAGTLTAYGESVPIELYKKD